MAAGEEVSIEQRVPGPDTGWPWLLDRAPFLVACAMLIVLVATYASFREGVFSLDELNQDTAAAMTLILAATGQTIVLLRGGIDLSIGGMISLGTVLAATRFGEDSLTTIVYAALIVGLGSLVGVVNGVLITVLRLQPFLVTLATFKLRLASGRTLRLLVLVQAHAARPRHSRDGVERALGLPFGRLAAWH